MSDETKQRESSEGVERSCSSCGHSKDDHRLQAAVDAYFAGRPHVGTKCQRDACPCAVWQLC